MLKILKLKSKDHNSNKEFLFSSPFKGLIRYFPPGNLEWFNSIYSFNKNNMKLLSNNHNIIINLIRSYFNMLNTVLNRKLKLRRLRKWARKISIKKIWVSKPELKHTNNKIIITMYVFNREYNYFLKKLRKIEYYNNKSLKKTINKINIIKNKRIKWINKIELINKKLLKNINSKFILLTKYNSFNIMYKKYLFIIKKHMLIEKLNIFNRQIVLFNKFKLKDTYLLPLKKLIEKVYNKKVEFNIINLKHYYLNSDILTQIVDSKIRNRKNSLLRVLKNSIRRIKTPKINKHFVETRKDLLKFEKIKYNTFLEKILNVMSDNNNDKLTNILEISVDDKPNKKDLKKVVINSIKHKTINGIRLEASGRLTKRITAARSISKVKYKGSLREIDSSYKGLSTVLLKGNQKSNIQYTKLNSKVRGGSFGLKGWISSV